MYSHSMTIKRGSDGVVAVIRPNPASMDDAGLRSDVSEGEMHEMPITVKHCNEREALHNTHTAEHAMLHAKHESERKTLHAKHESELSHIEGTM